MSETNKGLTGVRRLGNIRRMIEAVSFLLGAGFSFFVYVRSIRTLQQPAFTKAMYFLFTFIGITGTVFLFGVLVADALRKSGYAVH